MPHQAFLSSAVVRRIIPESPVVSTRLIAFAVFALFACAGVRAEISGLSLIATGLNQPVFVTHAPGDTEHLFVVERGGSIQVLDRVSGAVLDTYLTIPDAFAAGDGGLLGMAFHPDFQTNGLFYVHVTVANGGAEFQGASAGYSSHIREYSVTSATTASLESQREIYQAIQPQRNHNGGWIGFSPSDEFLYIALGDGGGGNDNQPGHTPGTGNAQDITNNPLGAILRLDVNGDDFPADGLRNYAIPSTNPFADAGLEGDDEIWAYGLRNPWRSSFDRETGDFWIGDVGQDRREEINWQPNGEAGFNYGWRLREGDIATPGVGGDPPNNTVEPVYVYDSDGLGDFGGNSVVGGYIYRGPDASLQGRYFFADSYPSQLWAFDPSDPIGTVANIESILIPNRGAVDTPVSFGEDALGNLYIVDLDGDIFLIETDHSLDLVGDYNADGVVDVADFNVWRDSVGSTGLPPYDLADGNGDGSVDEADYDVWRSNFGSISTAGSETVAVPEPGTLPAVIFAFCIVTRRWPLSLTHSHAS